MQQVIESFDWTIESDDAYLKRIYLTSQTNNIWRIDVYKVHSNSWVISVFVSNYAVGKSLYNAALEVGVPLWNDTSCCYSLKTVNTAVIVNFINLLKKNVTNFSSIENNLCELLAIDLNQQCTSPSWVKYINRNNFSYLTAKSDSIVKCIDIYDNNDLWLIKIFLSKPENKQTLKDVIVASGYKETYLDNQDSYDNPLIVRERKVSIIANLMQKIKSLSCDFNEIEEEVAEIFGIDFDQNYPVQLSSSAKTTINNNSNVNSTQSFTFYAQSGTYFSVNLKTNAEKTDGIINDEDIPTQYKCPLTLSIMTDPVCLPDDATKSVFERKAITKWLNQTGTHPLSRVPFSASSLQSANYFKDNKLQLWSSNACDLEGMLYVKTDASGAALWYKFNPGFGLDPIENIIGKLDLRKIGIKKLSYPLTEEKLQQELMPKLSEILAITTKWGDTPLLKDEIANFVERKLNTGTITLQNK